MFWITAQGREAIRYPGGLKAAPAQVNSIRHLSGLWWGRVVISDCQGFPAAVLAARL